MTILIVSRCLPWPLEHGDRLILCHLLRAFGARGHECDLLAFDDDSAGDAHARAVAGTLCRRLTIIAEHRRSVVAYAARLRRPFPERAAEAWHPEMWQAIDAHLGRRRYDLVFFFGGIQVYEFLGAIGSRPSVIVPYESYGLYLERVAAAGSITRWPLARLRLALARQYERRIYRGFDAVVVLTDRDRAALLRRAPGLPVTVIPNGVRLSHLPRTVAQPPELVFVGNYSYAPNVRAAVTLARDVLPLVRHRHPAARVVLVGAHPPPAVTALAGPQVTVTGWVPSVDPYLARAACFAAPLTEGAGMKNKVLEAMGAGVPVVTTPIGLDGLAVTPGDAAIVAATPHAVAEAAVHLIDAPDEAARLGARGRAYVAAHHSWDDVAARYEQVCRRAIAARSPR